MDNISAMADENGLLSSDQIQVGDPAMIDALSDTGPISLNLNLAVGPPSPLTGSYLLIVIGEPYSHDHKDIILQKLLKGEL